jgi:hypothetical protein
MAIDLHQRFRRIIDDKGRVWFEGDPMLRHELLCADYGVSLELDVVRNLGFVSVLVFKRHVQVRLHALNVSSVAIASALYLLHDHEEFIDTIEINLVNTGEVYRHDKPAGIERIIRISELANASKRVTAKSKPIEYVNSISDLSNIFSFWQQNKNACNISELINISNQATGGRHIVVRYLNAATIEIESVGGGFMIPDPVRTLVQPGRKLTELPDQAYFTWVRSCYAEASASGRPSVSSINAKIFWPQVGWTARQYIRLLLPCIDQAGRPFLFSANSNAGVAASSLRKVV